MERIAFPGPVPGRMSEKWSAILPQGISTSKISECEIGCLKDVKETERETGNETQVREDGRC